MSVLLRPDRSPADWTWLPLLAGLAVADSLRAVADVPAVLKWPNDVLVDGAKVCGILAERVDTPAGPACVLGLGINVHLRADELPVPTATSLAVLRPDQVFIRTEITATVLAALALLYHRWEDGRDGELAGSTRRAATRSAGPYGCCGVTGRRPRAERSIWTPRDGSGSGRGPGSRCSRPAT